MNMRNNKGQTFWSCGTARVTVELLEKITDTSTNCCLSDR